MVDSGAEVLEEGRENIESAFNQLREDVENLAEDIRS